MSLRVGAGPEDTHTHSHTEHRWALSLSLWLTQVPNPGCTPVPTGSRQQQNHKCSCPPQTVLFKFSAGRVPGWRRQWHPTPVLLPGKSRGWRSLVGCSPWGRYESDTTEQLHFHFSLSCIGEGNGNPLQYSCLENPRDGGA